MHSSATSSSFHGRDSPIPRPLVIRGGGGGGQSAAHREGSTKRKGASATPPPPPPAAAAAHQQQQQHVVFHSLLGTRYVLHKQLASGAQGNAYLATLRCSQREFVVLKQLRVRAGESPSDEIAVDASGRPTILSTGLSGTAASCDEEEKQQQQQEQHQMPLPLNDEMVMRVAEARAMSLIRHPNVVTLREAWFEAADHHLWLASGYCAGRDIRHFCGRLRRAMPRSSSPLLLLPEAWVRSWLADALRGVDALHSLGMIHRDISVNNLFLDTAASVYAASLSSGLGGLAVVPPPRLLVGDLGLVAVLSSADSTASTCCGTVAFMSPELAAGARYRSSIDVWSVGAVFFYVLSGLTQLPFGPSPARGDVGAGAGAFPPQRCAPLGDLAMLQSIVNDAPAELPPESVAAYSQKLRHLVASVMMTKDPRQRPSAAEVLAMLEAPDGSCDASPPPQHQMQQQQHEQRQKQPAAAAAAAHLNRSPTPHAAGAAAAPALLPVLQAPPPRGLRVSLPCRMMLLKYRLPKRSMSTAAAPAAASTSSSASGGTVTLSVNVRARPSARAEKIAPALEALDCVLVVQAVKSEEDGAVWFRIAEPHEGWCLAALQGRPLFTCVQEMDDFTHFVEPPSPRPPSVSVPRSVAAAAGSCASPPPSPVPMPPQQHE